MQKITTDGTFVVLAGGPDDATKGAQIAEAAESGSVLDMTGKTSLRELAALIKGCSFYISADTAHCILRQHLKSRWWRCTDLRRQIGRDPMAAKIQPFCCRLPHAQAA